MKGLTIPNNLAVQFDIENRIKEKKELKQQRVKMLKDFRTWVNSRTEHDYEAYKPIGALVLVRLYLYEPEVKEDKVIYTGWDDDGSGYKSIKSQMLPFAKVLATGTELPDIYKDLEPGDIVLIPDNMCSVEENPQWIEWQMIAREKPSIGDDWPMPPRYIPTLSKWGNYVFKKDKFMPGEKNDAYTFLIPPNMIRCKVDTDKIK